MENKPKEAQAFEERIARLEKLIENLDGRLCVAGHLFAALGKKLALAAEMLTVHQRQLERLSGAAESIRPEDIN